MLRIIVSHTADSLQFIVEQRRFQKAVNICNLNTVVLISIMETADQVKLRTSSSSNRQGKFSFTH
jgi:hypothetical protein